MKRKTWNLLAAVCVFLAGLMLCGLAAGEDASEYSYTVNEDGTTCTITGYSGEGGDVVIPSQIDGYPVTSIGERVFYNNRSIQSVVIPEGITSIGAYTFEECYNLSDITIPESITEINARAFSYIKSWGSTKVHISSIEKWLMINFASFGSNPLEYAHHLYLGDQEITEIDIPDSVTGIKPYVFSGASAITSVTIPEGVTAIGSYAFRNCKALAIITLPESVTEIGDCAFSECTSLAGITLPESVTEIGGSAFSGCTSLAGITLPEGMNLIGSYVFSGCTALTEITIPSSVTKIANNAFATCSSLTSVTFQSSRLSIESNAFMSCNSLSEVHTDSLRNWLQFSFGNNNSNPIYFARGLYVGETKVTRLIIPDDVTSVNAYAFYGCAGLEEISIPASVTAIGNFAFYDCSDLKTVSYAGTREQYNAIQIGTGVFKTSGLVIHCTDGDLIPLLGQGTCGTNLTWTLTMDGVLTVSGTGKMSYSAWSSSRDDILLVNVEDGVTSIASSAFSQCVNLTAVNLSDSVTSIESYAFYECSGLTDIYFPASLNSIGNYAFYNCASLASIRFGGTTEEFCSIAIGTNNLPVTTRVIHCADGDYLPTIGSGSCGENLTWELKADGVLKISGTGAMTDFSYGGAPWYSIRSYIQSVEMEQGITRIGNYAFCGCEKMSLVNIPTGVTEIGSRAFYNCSSLPAITLPEGITAIEESAFSSCDVLAEVIIPDGVVSIQSQTFYYCAALTEITIPASVTSIAYNAFDYSGLASVTYAGNGYEWFNIDLGSSSHNMFSTLPIHCLDVDLPVSAHGACGENVYYYRIENTLIITGSGPMKNYYSYSDTAPWYNTYSTITSVEIRSGVTSVGDFSFINCSQLASVTIAEGVTYIGEQAFARCENLTQVTLPESLVTLGPSAFAYCRGLTEVTIPANVAHITSVPFYYASNISAIHVAENNVYFASENGVLFDREKTTLLEYPCGKSGAYTVPDEVTAIGNYAFSSSTGLTEITLPEGLATIGADAFQACSGLTTVNMPSAMTSIGSRAFRYCYNLKNIVIPKGVKTIESSTFYMNSALESVTIPLSVTSIGDSAFYNCGSLMYVHYTSFREKWEEVVIGTGNEALSNAAIDYGTEEDETDNKFSAKAVGDTTVTAIVNSTPTFTIEASCAVGEIHYQWYQSGGTSEDATSASYVAQPMKKGTTTVYCTVTDDYEHSKIIPYTITLDNQFRAYADQYQYKFSVKPNETVTMKVIASCVDGEIHYQWSEIKDYYTYWVDNTTNQHTTDAIVKARKFQCEVTDDYENRNVLYFDIAIDNELKAERAGNSEFHVPYGTTVSLDINASCAVGELTYEWKVSQYDENGSYRMVDVEGANGHAIETVPITYRTNYSCTVQDAYGNSEYLTWTVYVENHFSVAPDGEELIFFNSGDDVTFRVLPTSDAGDFTYQWFKVAFSTPQSHYNYSYVSGAAQDEFTVENVGTNLKAYCQVTDQYGNFIQQYFTALLMGENAESDFTWQTNEDGVTLTGYTGNGGALTIPETLGGLPVTEIKNYAVYGNRKITAVTIPGTVRKIGDSAFWACSYIERITLSEGLTTIGNDALCGTGIQSLHIPASVTSISGNPAYYDGSLSQITVAEGNTSYCSVDGVLFSADRKTLIGFPAARKGSYSVPDGVETIGENAFYSSDLATVTFPESLKRIGAYAFYATLIEKIDLPAGLTGLGEAAFSESNRLTSAVIRDGITSIGKRTFERCNSLTRVTIPASVTEIGEYAFYYNTALTDVYYGSNSRDWEAITIAANNDSLYSAAIHYTKTLTNILTLPARLTVIESEAFAGLPGVDAVRIPASVTSIADDAFAGSDITILAPAGSYAIEWAIEKQMDYREE